MFPNPNWGMYLSFLLKKKKKVWVLFFFFFCNNTFQHTALIPATATQPKLNGGLTISLNRDDLKDEEDRSHALEKGERESPRAWSHCPARKALGRRRLAAEAFSLSSSALLQRGLQWWFQGALSLSRILRLGFALKAGGVEKERGRERGILGLASVKGRGRLGGEMSSQLGLGRGCIQPCLQGSARREPVWKVTLPCR